MRISDWSSDVCSSDLIDRGTLEHELIIGRHNHPMARTTARPGHEFDRPYRPRHASAGLGGLQRRRPHPQPEQFDAGAHFAVVLVTQPAYRPQQPGPGFDAFLMQPQPDNKTEEHRYGQEGVRQGRFRWGPSQ